MSTLKSQAIIIRSVDYQDSNRIFTMYTKEMGKISVLARGARKSQKRFGGALEFFCVIDIIAKKSRDMWILAESKLLKLHSGLAKETGRFNSTSFILELLRESTKEHMPDPVLFRLICDVMKTLEVTSADAVYAVTANAVIQILNALGINIGLKKCNCCQKEVPPGKSVLFNPARGGVICSSCGGGQIKLSAETIDMLIKISNFDLEEARRINIDSNLATRIGRALTVFIDYHLDVKLRTREFLTK